MKICTILDIYIYIYIYISPKKKKSLNHEMNEMERSCLAILEKGPFLLNPPTISHF